MKSTGIVRKVDELGRIVLPIELRRTLDIVEKDALEIYVDGSSIILKKYQPSCIFCGDAKDIIHYKDKNICSACLQQLQSQNLSHFFYMIQTKTPPVFTTDGVFLIPENAGTLISYAQFTRLF